MSELKGGVFAMAFFVGIIIPFLLMIGIDSLHQHAFLKTTEEMAELVKEEGGVSDHVKQVANNLSKRGYTVTFSKSGIVQFGEEVVIRYQYKYKNVRGIKNMDTKNKVVIHKRSGGRSTGNNQGNNGGINNPPKSFAIKTSEALNAENEYTFVIPGLKKLQDVTSDTGAVEIVRIDGENITVKVSDGAVIRTVQTGGKYIPSDTKFVTEEKTHDYNKDGYKGTLQLYDKIPSSSKKVVDEKPHLGQMKYSCQNGQWEKEGYSAGLNRNIKYSDPEGYEGYIGENYGGTFERIKMDYDTVMNYVDEYGLLNNTSQKVSLKSPCSKEIYPEEGEYLEEDWMYLQASGTEYFVVGKLIYSGTVQRPEVSLYQGNVTRPEVDTRTYDNYYQYKLNFEYLGA